MQPGVSAGVFEKHFFINAIIRHNLVIGAENPLDRQPEPAAQPP